MNKKQQENLAEYCYDVSKITLGTLVIGPLLNPTEYKAWILVSGSLAAIGFLILGYLLDERGNLQ